MKFQKNNIIKAIRPIKEDDYTIPIGMKGKVVGTYVGQLEDIYMVKFILSSGAPYVICARDDDLELFEENNNDDNDNDRV